MEPKGTSSGGARALLALLTSALLVVFGVGLAHAATTGKSAGAAKQTATTSHANAAATAAQDGDHGNGTVDPPPDDPPCDADGGHPNNPNCDGHEHGDTCHDGIDNDGDGATDGEDSDCQPKPECNDGVDNDGDGKVDADDPGCSNPGDDSEDSDGDGGGGGDTCTDGQDNDGDGATDGADTECQEGGDGVEDGSDGGGGGDANTCATGGLLTDPTLAEQIAGPGIDENGPLSSQLHEQLEPNTGPLTPAVHEVSCVVAILDGTPSG
jgi:hypothetical protein